MAIAAPQSQVNAAATDLKSRLSSYANGACVQSDPKNTDQLLKLLAILYKAGREDLVLGRLFEGHVDALQIIMRYGDAKAIKLKADYDRTGATYGVWNAHDAGNPLFLRKGQLSGGKLFASGAGIISHALVTADIGQSTGLQLILLPIAKTSMQIDPSSWNVTGMKRSHSYKVSWEACKIDPSWLVGEPGDYETQPWFSGGAIRYVTVQAGGIASLFDKTRGHLVATGRDSDPIQAARLGTLYSLAQQSWAMISAAAPSLIDSPPNQIIAIVAAVRIAVLDNAQQAITLARQAVGVQSAFDNHPLASVISDLSVYLCQPAPDAHRVSTGKSATAGLIKIGPDHNI